jgi:Mannosyl-glycoprotein endo-beta-N-acetylglucosaminidase
MKAERTEGINARYFVAHALLESGWGTSDIARLKRNLFGYNAFDRDPWKHASSFRTYEQGIMAVAKKIRGSYLTRGGRFFYRYTTLRAMNVYYASDLRWADKIAHIANVVDRLVVTLKERGLRFGTPTLRGAAHPGARVSLDVPWTARRGAVLPPRVRFAVRWTPVALVEADAEVPAAVPATGWELVARRSPSGRVVRLALRAPSRPGTWRLDVEARDSDGQPLPKTDNPPVRSLTVRVTADHEVSLALATAADGRLAVTVANVGSAALAASRGGTPTRIEAWALPLDPDRPAYRLGSRPLGGPLRAGASRVVKFAAPRDPAVVVVRVSGDPGAVGRSRPVAALVERVRNRRVTLDVLPVGSPRDDALLGRAPTASRVSLAARPEPGTVRATVVPAEAPREAALEAAAAEAPPGPPSLLVRSVAAEPGRSAEPSSTLVVLPAGQERAVDVDAAGLPAGVRLVVAGIVPPDGGPLGVTTLSLAWLPVTAVPDPETVPH